MTAPLHDSERAFYRQGRIDMRDKVVADLGKRIGIIAESLRTVRHKKKERLALEIAKRSLEVARGMYAASE